MCIALACTEWENPDDTFITRLTKNGYAKEYDFSANHERELVSNALSSMQSSLNQTQVKVDSYTSAYNANKDDYASLDEYVEKTCNEDEYYEYKEYVALTEKIKAVTITPAELDNDGNVISAAYTLYDIVMKDSALWTENDFETIRLSMTKGQIGVLSAVGLEDLIEFEEGVHNSDIESKIDSMMDEFYELNTETVSVYYGVDTSVFTDPEHVALTSDALRALNSSDTSSYGVKEEENNSLVKKIVGGVCAGIAVGCLIGYFVARRSVDVGIHLSETMMSYLPDSQIAELTGSVASKVCVILAVIVLVAFAVSVFMFYLANKEDVEDIDYKQIPRAIVDLIETDGEKVYYTYTAAKRIDAKDDSDNTLEVYGDLNAYNKKNEWVAVYYSKNRDLGNPITSDVLVNPSEVPTEGYTAFHEFGSTAATDLNKCNSGKDSKEIYAYVKTTTFPVAEVQTASVFSSGSLVLIVSTFVVGALLSGVLTYKTTKKKYRPSEAK